MLIRHLLPQATRFAVAFLLLVSISSAQSLTTTYAHNNGQSGNMFDIVASTAVTITGFDVNIDNTCDIEVYITTAGGSHVGQEQNSGAWTLVGSSASVPSLGAGVASPVPLVLNVTIGSGQTQAFYVTSSTGTQFNYTNGTSVGATAASNADITITEGTGNSYPFGSVFQPRVWNGTVHYSAGGGVTDDMAMLSIDAPTGGSGSGCSALGTNVPVSVTVRNNGTNAISSGLPVPISYTVDDGVNSPITVNEVMTVGATMAQGGTASYTFAAGASLTNASLTYTFSSTVSMVGDLVAANDTVSGHAVSGGGGALISVFPWTEDFDAAASGTTMPTGWVNVQGENTGGTSDDWIIDANGTPSTNTGPSGDHTTGSGNYAYTEDSTPSSYAAINLRTPCLDLTGSTASILEFWMHSNAANGAGVNENFLAIDIIDGAGNVLVADVIAPIGHLGQNWVSQTVSLAAFSGQIIRVQFRSRTDGGSYVHDIAIDDVRVYEPTVQNGQAPQAGLAVFDINNATDPNGFGVSSGVNGPYTANVNVGDPVNLEVLGAANQPVMLLTGPLNVGVATFPGIGQMDIGVSGGTMPGGITIIGSGGGPTFFDQFFFTDSQGYMSLQFGLTLPVGTSYPMQCIVYTGGPTVVAASNAVVLNAM